MATIGFTYAVVLSLAADLCYVRAVVNLLSALIFFKSYRESRFSRWYLSLVGSWTRGLLGLFVTGILATLLSAFEPESVTRPLNKLVPSCEVGSSANGQTKSYLTACLVPQDNLMRRATDAWSRSDRGRLTEASQNRFLFYRKYCPTSNEGINQVGMIIFSRSNYTVPNTKVRISRQLKTTRYNVSGDVSEIYEFVLALEPENGDRISCRFAYDREGKKVNMRRSFCRAQSNGTRMEFELSAYDQDGQNIEKLGPYLTKKCPIREDISCAKEEIEKLGVRVDNTAYRAREISAVSLVSVGGHHRTEPDCESNEDLMAQAAEVSRTGLPMTVEVCGLLVRATRDEDPPYFGPPGLDTTEPGPRTVSSVEAIMLAAQLNRRANRALDEKRLSVACIKRGGISGGSGNISEVSTAWMVTISGSGALLLLSGVVILFVAKKTGAPLSLIAGDEDVGSLAGPVSDMSMEIRSFCSTRASRSEFDVVVTYGKITRRPRLGAVARGHGCDYLGEYTTFRNLV